MFHFKILFSIWVGIGLFQISIWYMIWYVFGIWFSIQKWPKKWPWLKMSDQILLILVYMQYSKITDIWTNARLFSLHHLYVQYQWLLEMNRNDYFWLVCGWYVTLPYRYSDLFLLWCEGVLELMPMGMELYSFACTSSSTWHMGYQANETWSIYLRLDTYSIKSIVCY